MLLRFCFCIVLLGFVGCATVAPPESTTASYASRTSRIEHVVQKGQTLWRISKLYGVELETIAKTNKISDSASITPGQTLIIPGASAKSQAPSTNFSSSGNGDFIWPVKGKLLAYFKQKTNGTINKGIDIATTPHQDVSVCADGKVIFIGRLIGYGQTVIIDHGDNLSSVTCGNTDVAVRLGDDVKQGMTLAKTGLSPRYGEGTLHFEIRKKHKPQNPLYFLN